MTEPGSSLSVTLAGEIMVPLAERALWWPRGEALFVADLHWGKAATFRSVGVPLPRGTTSFDLGRLDGALERTGASRLIILGDLFHARAGRIAEPTLAAVRDWRARRAHLDILLIRGNHDRHAGDPPNDLAISCMDAPVAFGPFVLAHHPVVSVDGYTLAGHLHPAIALVGSGRRRERLPCFHLGDQIGVLPAFGSFTGTALVRPGAGDRIFVIADDQVAEISVPPSFER
ncbi:MAG: ligase-associated DNA damage response endonuclease PdeM [Gemmatimonadota bacterium]